MHQVILLARFALCAIFAIAALEKARDRRGFSDGLAAFGISVKAAPLLANALIASEFAVACALLVDASAVAGALGALLLLVTFTCVLVANVARGRRPACNCFGANEQRPIGWDTVARNVALLAIAAFVAARTADAPFVPTFAATFEGLRSDGNAGVLLVACLVLLAISGTFGFVLWHVVRQQGRILVRLEALEALELIDGDDERASSASASHRGLPLGAPAPTFALANLDGAEERLDDFVTTERPLLLVFVNPHCGPCNALLPEIAAWRRDYPAALDIVLVSEGTAAENREKAGPGLERVLLQREREVADAYRAYGTPAAVLIERGRIASAVAQGAAEIRAVVSEVLDGRPQPALTLGDAVPAIALQAPAGDVTLNAVVDGETVIVFWNPHCGFCSAMLDDLRAWENGRDESDPKLVLISTAIFDDAFTQSGSRVSVLLDAESKVATAFGAAGTPMAVRVDADRRIASRVVAGRDAVLELLRGDRVVRR